MKLKRVVPYFQHKIVRIEFHDIQTMLFPDDVEEMRLSISDISLLPKSKEIFEDLVDQIANDFIHIRSKLEEGDDSTELNVVGTILVDSIDPKREENRYVFRRDVNLGETLYKFEEATVDWVDWYSM